MARFAMCAAACAAAAAACAAAAAILWLGGSNNQDKSPSHNLTPVQLPHTHRLVWVEDPCNGS
eukprot:106804-Rhodomonas_salina.1